MLGWLFPPLRVAALLVATMTMFTRLLVGAHFTTDAYAAIVLSYAGCVLLWKLSPPRPLASASLS
jgi:membrane-associated phospholipid phosphatase